VLIERQAHLDGLAATIDAARRGDGRVVLVEGVAGVGKTRLVEEAKTLAGRAGITVYAARGGELERDFAWGVVRSLLGRSPTQLGDDAYAGAARLARPIVALDEDSSPSQPLDTPSALHGLYWLTTNLAEANPIMLAVDDLQWADRESLHFLLYLARRLEGLRLLVVLATRPVETTEPGPLSELALEASGHHFQLEPLSRSATGVFLERTLGGDMGPAFRDACHGATGGNPFFLVQLLQALEDQNISPGHGAVGDVEAMGAPSIARSVLLRVARLGAEAVALVRAVSVLGDDVDLRLAARLADVEEATTAKLADRLRRAYVFDAGPRLSFVHPIVHRSVYDDVVPEEMSRLHRTAARLLTEVDASADRIAAHLIETRPAHDPEAIEQLRLAARDARGRAAPEAACAYLTRALAESPAGQVRAAVLHELGLAEAEAHRSTAAARLQEALDLSADPAQRVQIVQALVTELVIAGSVIEPFELLERTLDELETGDVSPRWEAVLAETGMGHAETADRARRRLHQVAQGSETDPWLQLALAIEAMLFGESADHAVQLASSAFQGGRLFADLGDEFSPYTAIMALSAADHFDEADRMLTAALADAQRRGSRRGLALASCFRVDLRYRLGDVAGAVADAQIAIDMLRDEHTALLAFTQANLAGPLIERAKVDEAGAMLAGYPAAADTPPYYFASWPLDARGRVHLAAGRYHEALDDLLGCGSLTERFQTPNPALLPWRSTAARAAIALGDRERAVTLADAEVELTSGYGAPRALGIALVAAGLAHGGDDGIDRLRAAVETLRPSAARLEHARALVELGAVLRRGNRRKESRQPLQEGLDLARRCGATVLADRAIAELRATGARPRRAHLSGREALTPSELRVAELAAQGQTNKEIAQALFVTQKTIETHLSRTYQKLDITSRHQLAGAL
jgi:DNA-binding CsgD family transcriptional regulator